LPSGEVQWPRPTLPLAQLARIVPLGARPLDVMALLVQVAALSDPHRGDGRPDAFVARGRLLVPLLAAALAPELAAATVTRALGASQIAGVVARALGLDDAAVPLIDLALIVLADHELNASSFTARVAASTEADPYACVAAALAAVSGPRHGSAAEAIAAFADEVGSPDQARAAVRALRRKGQVPHGFGHPLYPDGDPRALPLLAAARGLVGTGSRGRGASPRARTLLAIVEASAEVRPPRLKDRSESGFGPGPSVDVGLAALVAALGAPATAGPGLFAVARSAGWLAHALEQRSAGFLLRPRARYVGAPVTP
jgi:citrate synthase